MLTRINIPPALMMTLEVQPARRDDAKQALQGRECNRRLRYAREAWTFAALQILFVLGRQAITKRRHRFAEAYGVRRQRKYRRITLRTSRNRATQREGSATGKRDGLLEEPPPILNRREYAASGQRKGFSHSSIRTTTPRAFLQREAT